MNTQQVYLDVFVTSFYDQRAKRIRVRPLPGQSVPDTLLVKCPRKMRNSFPEGTVFKLDVCLMHSKRGVAFLRGRAGQPMQRAIEHYEHNLKLQKSLINNKMQQSALKY